MSSWTSRAFVLSILGLAGSFYLALHLNDATAFTLIAPVAIGGQHAVNWRERHPKAPPPEAK